MISGGLTNLSASAHSQGRSLRPWPEPGWLGQGVPNDLWHVAPKREGEGIRVRV